MADSLKKMIDTIPKVYQPQYNKVISALVQALSESDDEISRQIQNAKDQIFIRTATGENLDKASNSLGVSRPQTLGLSDEEYQELVPNLSLKPKQIKKAFYDTSDVFWGPLFSRANVTSNNSAPFSVSVGDVFSISVDNGPVQNIKVLVGDLATNGSASAEEIQRILSRIKGVTPSVLEESITGNKRINLRTDTPGSVGNLEILSCSMVGVSKLDFTLGSFDILDLPQRVAVYNVNPNELLIEIPAIVPALRRTLKGSHHFHQDGTLEPPVAPNQGIWRGSFFFNPDGSVGTFSITSQKATLNQTINKGQVYTSLTVSGANSFVQSSGLLIINFGMETEEQPIKYRGIPNSNTILIDPSHVWRHNHFSGEIINVLLKQEPYVARKDGTDLAIYLTSPSGAREVVQNVLETLKAAGIVIHFLILAPKYKYLLDNPYITSDNEPSV